VLVRQALSAVAPAGGQRLTLAVDAGNTPAMKLYFRHGMQRVGVKTAMMRELGPITPAGGGAT
jgi:ribosomal protein S18 acetylase RimI-like enzyme